MSDKLRIIFMGTPDFALPSLEMLYNTCELKAVFCQPDKANARGNKINYCPVKKYALENGIPVYQPETLRDNACADVLRQYDPELIAVAAYGKLLPDYVLSYPKYGCINVHGSLLPRYRGASPIQAAVLNGDKTTGITIMYMGKGLDTGDIILQRETDIGENETAGELFDRMSLLGSECLEDAVKLIINGRAMRTKQDESKSTHVSIITKEMGRLDFDREADEIRRLVLGLNPWPSAYIEAESGIIKIHRVIPGKKTDKSPGKIVSVTKDGIGVACKNGGSVIITEIQKQGKKKMDAYSFSLGVRLTQDTSIYSL